eukprot:3927819-Prymnesium_polylepis.1
MAKCDECGPGAGHQTKHCLVVAYDKPIPVGISDSRRARIEAARKQGVQDQEGRVGQRVLRLGRGALVPPADGARPELRAARPHQLAAEQLVDPQYHQHPLLQLIGATEWSERRDERPSGRVAS